MERSRRVIEAYKLARREVDCSLVLLGNVATDDPEVQEVYQSLLSLQNERIRILSCEDTGVVNALQRRAAVGMQKWIREGFGLTVAEAMWKRTPVMAGMWAASGTRLKTGQWVSGLFCGRSGSAGGSVD